MGSETETGNGNEAGTGTGAGDENDGVTEQASEDEEDLDKPWGTTNSVSTCVWRCIDRAFYLGMQYLGFEQGGLPQATAIGGTALVAGGVGGIPIHGTVAGVGLAGQVTVGELAGTVGGAGAYGVYSAMGGTAEPLAFTAVGARVGTLGTWGAMGVGGFSFGLGVGTSGYCTYQCAQNTNFKYP
jgi:hypothetical protein